MGGSSPNADLNIVFGKFVYFCVICVVFIFQMLKTKLDGGGGWVSLGSDQSEFFSDY